MKKNTSYYNQVARDEKGRKRFHGAFQGGNVAGYNNTVGSKEGFVAREFFSTRQKRAELKQQSIFDHMDDEDLGSTIAGKNLNAKGEYDTLGTKKYGQLQEGQDSKLNKSISIIVFLQKIYSIFLSEQLVDIVANTKTSIGYQIYENLAKQKKQSFKDDINIDEQYGLIKLSEMFKADREKKLQSKKNYNSFDHYFYKNNYEGLGYEKNSYKPQQLNELIESDFDKLLKEKIPDDDENDITAKKKKNQLHINSIFDGNEAGEYEKKSNIEYDKFIVEENEHGHKQEDQKKKLQEMIELQSLKLDQIFQPTAEILQIDKLETSLVIPKDYNPYNKVINQKQNSQQENPQKNQWLKLNYEQRQQLLEEQRKDFSLSEDQRNKANTLSIEVSKQQLLLQSKFKKGETIQESKKNKSQDMNSFFKGDVNKQARFRTFYFEMEQNSQSAIPAMKNADMEAIQKEQKEFLDAYAQIKNKEESKKFLDSVFEDNVGIDGNQNQSNQQEQKSIVQITNWVPDILLCKRFGVDQPKIAKRSNQQSQQPTKKIKKSEEDYYHENNLPKFFGNKNVAQKFQKQVEEKVTKQRAKNRFSKPQLKYFDKQEEYIATTVKQQSEQTEKKEKLESNSQVQIIEKKDEKEDQSMQLFKEIFGDSDSD